MEPRTDHSAAPTLAEVRAVATQCTCFALRRITRRVTQRYDELLAPAGIRITQFTLLGKLHAPEQLTVTALAERLDMDRTTLTRNLQPLIERKLVAVVQGPDARSRTVTLTQKGRQTFQRALPFWRQAQQDVRTKLGEDGAGRLHEVLRTSLQSLSAEQGS